MDDNAIKALLAITGAIAGAILAGVADAYAARQKKRGPVSLRRSYMMATWKMRGKWPVRSIYA